MSNSGAADILDGGIFSVMQDSPKEIEEISPDDYHSGWTLGQDALEVCGAAGLHVHERGSLF